MINSHLLNELLDARSELTKLIEKLSELEQNEPDGVISVKTINNRPACYVRTDSSDKTGRYLPKDRPEQIRALSQKLYNHKLKKACMEELGQYSKCLELLNKVNTSADDILKTIPEPLRDFVDTNVMLDEQTAAEFEKERDYADNPRESDQVFISPRGERFKSKSEWIIADVLRQHGVPFFYEKPFENGIYEELRTSKYNLHPDFTCLNKRTGKIYYWEHFGRLDDPWYVVKFIERIQNYAAYGVFLGSELMISVESKKVPLRISYIKGLIEKYLL